jgi:hypothetical protein
VRCVRDTATELSGLLDHAPEKSGSKVVNMWRG